MAKIKNYKISIYQDSRRKKDNGKYPVKLRVYSTSTKQQKLYPLNIDLSEAEFTSTWESSKPRKEYKDTRLTLQAIEAKANEIADKLPSFSFQAFERMMFGISGGQSPDVGFYYKSAIERYKKNGQIGTASNYELSLRSLLLFHGKDKLNFHTIDDQWLRRYEKHMTEELKKSRTTVGIYLRPLRAIFNTAIADKTIDPTLYPFDRRKYIIPAPKGIKKALSQEQLKTLFEAKPKSPEQEKARDFWFFSYSCNGMNFKDIAKLRYSDIQKDQLTFNRAKTKDTNKRQAPITVHLTDFAKMVIEKYGEPMQHKNQYVFPVLSTGQNEEVQHNQIKLFVRSINQQLKKLAQELKIDEPISTYWARHSFATQAVRKGASLEFVQESLGHGDLKTTQNYFAGFDDKKKKEFISTLMNFYESSEK